MKEISISIKNFKNNIKAIKKPEKKISFFIDTFITEFGCDTIIAPNHSFQIIKLKVGEIIRFNRYNTKWDLKITSTKIDYQNNKSERVTKICSYPIVNINFDEILVKLYTYGFTGRAKTKS